MARSRYRRRDNYDTPAGEKPGMLVRTYRLNQKTVRALDDVCVDNGWWPSALVDLLVRDGLRRLRSGDLCIRAQPVMYEIEIDERGMNDV